MSANAQPPSPGTARTAAAQSPLAVALAHHRAGRVEQAEPLYRELLRTDPNHPQACHLLGVLLVGRGRAAEAADLLARAVKLQPAFAPAHAALGNACEALGRRDEAAAAYRRAIDLDPKQVEALNNLGNLLLARGDPAEAIATLRQAVSVQPGLAVLHNNLGNALQAAKRPEAAIEAYGRALELNPRFAEAHNNLGNVLKALNRLAEAEACYRRAIALNPRYVDPLGNLGNLLQGAARDAEAIAVLQQALALKPDLPALHNNLGSALHAVNRRVEAEAAFRRAIELKPDFAEAHNNLGNVFKAEGRLVEAEACYGRALALNPRYVEAMNNLANTLHEQRRPAEAISLYRQSQSLQPELGDAYFYEALAQLQEGNLAEGFAKYEYRWRSTMKDAVRPFREPLWLGDAELSGRTILLHAEQGLGDTLQFVRYAPLAAAKGATVLLRVQAALKPLLTDLPGVAGVYESGDTLPAFDFQCPLMSLPHAFRTTLETVPASVPYLRAPVDRASAWRERLGRAPVAPRVGLVWSGNPKHKHDHKRSIPLSLFRETTRDVAASFFSLQKECRPADAAELRGAAEIADLAPALGDFSDTAAAIAEMDLIVTVDTSVAHLAGALGRPVWVLLPFASDWRWMNDRTDSPWYPTMRLFRQATAGDWAGPLREVRVALGAVSR